MRKCLLLLIVVCMMASFKPAKITWLAIGDSITYLNDHPSETGNRVSKGYLTRVTDQLSGITYINKGYNGWTSGGIAAEIDNLGLVSADVYTIFLGTNDWWQGRPLGSLQDYKANKGNETVFGSFRIIINKIRSLNPQAKILLVTPLQRADFVYISDSRNLAHGSYKPNKGQHLEDFAKAVIAIAGYEHIPVADLYHLHALQAGRMVKFKRLKDPQTGKYKNYSFREAINIPFNPETDEYPYPLKAINTTYDGLHPSDKGNAIIASTLVRLFKKHFIAD